MATFGPGEKTKKGAPIWNAQSAAGGSADRRIAPRADRTRAGTQSFELSAEAVKWARSFSTLRRGRRRGDRRPSGKFSSETRARESSMDTIWRIELLGWLRAVQADRIVRRFRRQKTGTLLA